MSLQLPPFAEDGDIQKVKVQSEVPDGGENILLEIVPLQTKCLVRVHPYTNQSYNS